MNSEKNEQTFKPVEEMSFEECFEELEQLVEAFEKGRMPLSESIRRFERGMSLIKRCSSELEEAEKKVNQLLSKISPVDHQNPGTDVSNDPSSSN